MKWVDIHEELPPANELLLIVWWQLDYDAYDNVTKLVRIMRMATSESDAISVARFWCRVEDVPTPPRDVIAKLEDIQERQRAKKEDAK